MNRNDNYVMKYQIGNPNLKKVQLNEVNGDTMNYYHIEQNKNREWEEKNKIGGEKNTNKKKECMK